MRKTIYLTLVAMFILINVGHTQDSKDCDPQNWEQSDDEKCTEWMSIFHNDAKNKNYEGALPFWRKYYCNCPKMDGAQKWVYIDGVKIMLDLIKKNKNDRPTLEPYYDTLMMIYDNWIINYQEEAKILSYKGLYTYAYQYYSIDRLLESKEYFEKSIELDLAATTYSTVAYYMTVLQKLTKYKKVDTTYWIDQYFIMSDHAAKGVAQAAKYQEKWQKTLDDLESMMQPVLQCEQLIPIYKKKLELEPSIDDLKKMVLFLDRKGCSDDPVYEKAANMLCEKEPSAICKIALARLMYKNGRYAEARKYVEEAINLEEDASLKSDYYLFMADISAKESGTNAAMNAVNKAISINPSNGRAFMIKAGLYAKLASGCKGFDKKAAFWVVVDWYIKAKSVDGSLTGDCNAKIAIYSKYFPESGDIFFETDESGTTLKIGAAYTPACLGVTTTIRARAEG